MKRYVFRAAVVALVVINLVTTSAYVAARNSDSVETQQEAGINYFKCVAGYMDNQYMKDLFGVVKEYCDILHPNR